MQFKYPELLWAILLLLIPIFIHLFQLRRFKKTPFTNVALLQKVVSNSRRSNTLKKWLLLFTRMLLLTAMVLAFAQPFFAKKTALTKKQTVIYIDDSFSMQAKSGNSTLLHNAIQELIQITGETDNIDLFTNDKEYRDVVIGDIQNELLALKHSSKQLSFEEIELKANTFFKSDGDLIKELIVVSDFQRGLGAINLDSVAPLKKYLVKMVPDAIENIALDSVFISKEGPVNTELSVFLSSSSENGSIPVSLYNGEQLIAKTAVEIGENKKGTVNFSILSKDVINGRLEISDSGLFYDNELYFNIEEKKKIKVLSIETQETQFLKRIFTEEEFEYSSTTPNTMTYSDIESQNLIVLNELNTIPLSLQTGLKSFKSNGGSLVVIPSVDPDLTSYNQLLVRLFNTSFIQNVNYERKIVNIDFSNPLYRNVFEKKVSNFQYPSVNRYKRVRTNAPSILTFQDSEPFLVGANEVFLFTASISGDNSNFKSSPLIVPTFYNMGLKSMKMPRLYSLIGNATTIDIAVQLNKDDILKVAKEGYEFIPQQQSFANKVSLHFIENPRDGGIYSVGDKQNTYQNLSFNHPRTESDLSYTSLEHVDDNSRADDIKTLFESLQKERAVTELWKWFVILALLFLMVEILILKFLK